MAAVKESPLDRLYRQINELTKRQPLSEDKVRSMITKARALKCGFVVERGAPGSLTLSPFVPENTIVKINMNAGHINQLRYIS